MKNNKTTNYIIHPINLFEMNSDKSNFTYRYNLYQRVMLPGYIWYIEGPEEHILVDAGGDVEYMWNIRGIPAKEVQTIESGLAKFGIRPDEIDLVILTHLHQDHVAQAFRFLKAKFIVQRKELDFAMNPHPSVAISYNKEFYESLDFKAVNGDFSICDGVSVISTPGHTPGGQSVCVKTNKGLAVISGLCSVRENFEPPSSVALPVIPPGIHTNILDGYDSFLKIKEIADIVLPLHDPKFKDLSSIP